jgi:redox-sensing transcriptional repressor
MPNNKQHILPPRTVERLSGYRRTLLNCKEEGKTHIYSHELAEIHNITPVQVRRDIMFIGYSSILKKGYDINELANKIGKILERPSVQNVAVIGMGNLGKAITGYFIGKRPKLEIVASFDVDARKTGRNISGITCYHINDMEKVIKEKKIVIALLTVPPGQASTVAAQLVNAGIKGILNFTSIPLKQKNVYVEDYDMITSLEKVAYFTKMNK